MSRIILARHGSHTAHDREHHIVVGWDRPLATFFWQEFKPNPRNQNGEVDWEIEMEKSGEADDSEMRGCSGYRVNEHPTIASLIEAMPTKFQHLMTEEVQRALEATVNDPNTGTIIEEMAPKSWKVEVQTLDAGGDSWSTNSIRFATFDEAQKAATSLRNRWMMVKNDRVSPSDDDVNYKIEDGREVKV